MTRKYKRCSKRTCKGGWFFRRPRPAQEQPVQAQLLQAPVNNYEQLPEKINRYVEDVEDVEDTYNANNFTKTILPIARATINPSFDKLIADATISESDESETKVTAEKLPYYSKDFLINFYEYYKEYKLRPDVKQIYTRIENIHTYGRTKDYGRYIGTELSKTAIEVFLPAIRNLQNFEGFRESFNDMLKLLEKRTLGIFRKKCTKCIYVTKKAYEMIRKLKIDSAENFGKSFLETFNEQYKKYHVNRYQKYISLVDFYYLIKSLLSYWTDESTRLYKGDDISKPVPGDELLSGINYALVDEKYHTQCVGEILDKENKGFQCRPNNVADAASLDKVIEREWMNDTFFECPFDEEYLKTRRKCTRKLHKH